jgi:DNA modification methylase
MAKPRLKPAPENRLWPADAVERQAVAELVPYAGNARTHSEAQVAQIAESIKAFGFTVPVLIDPAGGIIAGHGRVMAAKLLGLADVPVMVANGWTESQKRAYVLADNKIALNAGWDDALLRAELEALRGSEFDLGLTGFDAAELAGIFDMRPTGFADPDDAPAAPVVPVSALGDLWLLGRHRLLCGDATVSADVDKLLGGATPHLMVTDPPYGVNYDPAWRERAGIGHGGAAKGVVLNDNRADWREAWALFRGSVAYVWHGGLHSATVAQSLIAEKFQIRAQIIWVKSQLVISRSHYHGQHEPAFYVEREGTLDDHWRFEEEHEDLTYAVRDGEPANWFGGRKQSTVWKIDKPRKSETGHSTQKPVECMKRPIQNNSKPGDAVYEPFSGSGTTIIAGEMTGRKVYAIELNPAYVDVAISRWQTFTGLQATLDGDGRTFAAVSSERAPAVEQAAE